MSEWVSEGGGVGWGLGVQVGDVSLAHSYFLEPAGWLKRVREQAWI